MLRGAFTFVVVLLKMQTRHFYDFTLNHVDILKGKTGFEVLKLSIKVSTIPFVKGPNLGKAACLRA